MADVDPRDMEVPMATRETPQEQNDNVIKEAWSNIHTYTIHVLMVYLPAFNIYIVVF